MVPLAFAHLHREDSIRRGRFRMSFEMHETVEMLMNSVNVAVKAYVVPYLAFDKFDGMDQLNRSYEGKDTADGSGTKIDFFETGTLGTPGPNHIYTYMGLHGKDTDVINHSYREAYNQIWNFRAKNRSADITLRGLNENLLAPAFWQHTRFGQIVPDFDQAVIDGEVALNVANARMPVTGIGKINQVFATTNDDVYETGGTGVTTYPSAAPVDQGLNDRAIRILEDPDNPGFPAVFAELQANGITVSLSNIEMAKKTQAFAKLREQYTGHDDDYIIDLLMQGIRVPDQAWRQPVLVGRQDTIFGMSKRYAMDGADLTKSVVNGGTTIDMAVNVPRIGCGGILMIVAECLPEQLFERQQDPLFYTTEIDQLPNALRDELDPEKVEIVPNGYVDAKHTTGTGTFGYAPMGYRWDYDQPKIGGRFVRPDDDSFQEARQRIWAAETLNPTLAEDFYLATNINQKPFHDQLLDPFECVTLGECFIEGNTVFGGQLVEAQANYAAVTAQIDQSRIEKPAT